MTFREVLQLNVMRRVWLAQLVSLGQSQVDGAGPSAIFGASYATNKSLGAGASAADKGHLRIVFDNLAIAGAQNRMTSVDGDVYTGLPVSGFWSANYVNSSAQPGKLANYSGAVHHRGTRNIVGS